MTTPRPQDRVKVCVVCAGNICRSPIAEYVFNRRLVEAGLANQVTVESAGTGGWHVDEPADLRAVQVLHGNGYDAAGHRARQFRDTWFHEFDLILALDQANATDLRRLAPDDEARSKIRLLRSYDPAAKGSDLEVPDPYYGADAGFDHVLQLVEQAAAGFVAQMAAQLAATGRQSGPLA